MPLPLTQEVLDLMKKTAEKEAELLSDADKELACKAILAHKIAFGRAYYSGGKYLSAGYNVGMLLLSITLSIIGCCSLWCHWSITISAVIAGCSDLLLLALVVVVALHADGHADRAYDLLIPNRFPALIGGLFLFAGLLHSFGNLYLHSPGINDHGSACCNVQPKQLDSEVNALYFSTVTMITVGYGDLSATDRTSQEIVIWQLCSSVLLLIFFLPLLMSRIAGF